MGNAVVVARDRMQAGYRYELSEPEGENFDPDFRPELTPPELLCLGIFGGKYMTDCRDEFPSEWFIGAKLSPERRDPTLNLFGVDASQPLSVWRDKGWLHKDDPAAGFNGIADTTAVAAWRTIGGRSRGGRRCADMFGKSSAIASVATSSAVEVSGKPCAIGPTTAADLGC